MTFGKFYEHLQKREVSVHMGVAIVSQLCHSKRDTDSCALMLVHMNVSAVSTYTIET